VTQEIFQSWLLVLQHGSHSAVGDYHPGCQRIHEALSAFGESYLLELMQIQKDSKKIGDSQACAIKQEYPLSKAWGQFVTSKRYLLAMQLIGIWAVIAATLGPIQNVLGWGISGALWPGYDPIAKTISDLAADDSPVKWIQSSFFLFGSLLTLVGAWSARAFAMPGRIALGMAGIAGLGYTFYATPSQIGYSDEHRFYATVAFVLFSAWPILAMRFDKRYHWALRPAGAIGASVVMGLTTLWFLLTWLEPGQPIVGLSERVIAVMQVLWLSFAIWAQYLHQQKAIKTKTISLDGEELFG